MYYKPEYHTLLTEESHISHLPVSLISSFQAYASILFDVCTSDKITLFLRMHTHH